MNNTGAVSSVMSQSILSVTIPLPRTTTGQIFRNWSNPGPWTNFLVKFPALAKFDSSNPRGAGKCCNLYYLPTLNNHLTGTLTLKGAVGSADLKISKSALLSLNHHNFSNTEPIFTQNKILWNPH